MRLQAEETSPYARPSKGRKGGAASGDAQLIMEGASHFLTQSAQYGDAFR